MILQTNIQGRSLDCRSPIRRISEVMLLVIVTSSLWFLIAFASPCKDLPPKVALSVCTTCAACRHLPPKLNTASCFAHLHMCSMQRLASKIQRWFLFLMVAHVCSMQRLTPNSHHCFLHLRLVLADAHVAHAKTHLASQRCTPCCSFGSCDLNGSTHEANQ